MSRDVPPLAAESVDAWQNAEIDPATQRRAEQAAAAAGLGLEEWLERAIRRACPSAFRNESAPIAATLLGAPIPPSAAPVSEPTPLYLAPTIAQRLARQRVGKVEEDAARSFAPEQEERAAVNRIGEHNREKGPPLPPSRKNTRRLAFIGIAIGLAIFAGAVTAQYLIPGPDARAPATSSHSIANSAPTASASKTPPSANSDSSSSDLAAAANSLPVPASSAPSDNAAIDKRAAAAGPPAPRAAAPSDPKVLAPLLEQRAKNADAIAQYRLGVLYALGQGVQQDYTHAAELFKASAEGGIAEAQYNIAVLYDEGLGIGRDPVQAFAWYQKAAAQGNANAAFNLGVAYSNGSGVPQSMDQAAQWFQRAATAGVLNAQFNLALLYERGDGVPVSQVEAYAWYSAAAAHGDTGAAQRRGNLAATLTPAKLKEARTRAEQIAAMIKSGGNSAGSSVASAADKAVAPKP